MTVQTSARWIVAYLRVSSRSQDLATQRATILRRAQLDEIRPEAILWHEEKESGRTMNRPALRSLREQIRTGKVATLYVYRIDRLARSGIRDVLELVEEARLWGCRIWSTSDGIEVTGKQYELIVACLAWAAELELDANAERRDAARTRLEEEGRSWGRPSRCTDADCDRMLELTGPPLKLSVRQIAARESIPRATVNDALVRARARAAERPVQTSAREAVCTRGAHKVQAVCPDASGVPCSPPADRPESPPDRSVLKRS